MPNHTIEMIDEYGQSFITLEDIIPTQRPKVLIVGKVPSPLSVEAGHYFQGSMGQNLWNRLREYKLFDAPVGVHNDIGEDDYLIKHGYGITDVIKKPRLYGDEPTSAEYRYGAELLSRKIDFLKPHIVFFVFKRTLDKILNLRYQVTEHSRYGFNNQFSHLFSNCNLFVFPMSGTPATTAEIQSSMRELKEFMQVLKPD